MALRIKKSMLYIALIVLAAFCLLPFLLTMVNATRSGNEILTSFTFMPGGSMGENWRMIKNYFDMFRGFLNSILVALPATALGGYFSAITAYALAVYRFKGRNILFGIILLFMMIPSQLGLLGFYDLVSFLKLTNSYLPLVIPAIASPGIVFFLKQYTESVLSSSLLEAARIDGAKEAYLFHRIVLPIMLPGIATMSIGAFIGSWNSYIIPMLLLNQKEKFTLPLLIASLNSSTDITRNQGAIYLAVAISVIPILLAFCFLSRYIISSITAGSIKE